LMDNDLHEQHFKRGFEWDWSVPRGYSNATEASLLVAPLQAPPPIIEDKAANYAMKTYPNLFKIICPININMLKILLKDHPNQPFVISVLNSLHNRFWPMSNTPPDDMVINKNHSI
ncbi:hypothetical protein CROQUDRAFT_33225, partial [Cronartium quercuum f. sp. fusiforme G11]